MRAVIWCAVSSRAQTDSEEDPKLSLPSQEADARALADAQGWTVVEVLRVPGHSRRYIDIHELAADMAGQGIHAFARLLALWDRRAFDVLVCRDGSRFARTQALHAYVVERTISIGARIYSLSDGWIDEHNYRMWIAMGGYSAAGEIDRLVKARDKAMDERARRGLPTSAWVLFPYRLVRDERGRARALVLDESKRRLWDDLAALLLEGVGWHDIERELLRRFGHVKPDGRPFGATYFYQLVHNPGFWGHSARHFLSSSNGQRTDLWVFDPSEPPPEGVTIYYHTHEPVYTGELAERIQAELRRRRSSIRGSNRPHRSTMFSGLLLCGECHYTMVVAHKGTYTGFYCPSKDPANRRNPARAICSQRKQINERAVQAYVNDLLQRLLDEGPAALDGPAAAPQPDRAAQLQSEIAALEGEIRTMIQRQAKAPDAAQALYEEEIQRASARLKTLREALAAAQRAQVGSERQLAARAATLEDLRAIGLAAFWRQTPVAINQALHRVFGDKRLVVIGAEIVSIADAPQRARTPPRPL